MIETSLVTMLRDTGAKVFPLIAPANAVAPFAIYQRVSTVRFDDFDGPAGLAQATFRVDLYDKDYMALRTQANSVRIALDGYQDEEMAVSLEQERDLSDLTTEPTLLRVNLEFRITHSEQ